MDNPTHVSFFLTDKTLSGVIKKEIHRFAEKIEFNKNILAEIDIIVAELISNLLKYASKGEFLVKRIDDDGEAGIEIIAIDNGPGIANPKKMLQDGISTRGTLGFGLGAIKRLSCFFEIYSLVNWGTIIVSRVYRSKKELSPGKKTMEIRSVGLCKPGETESGDGWCLKQKDNKVRIFVADGLGHGPHAHFAVKAGVKSFKKCEEPSPSQVLRWIHNDIDVKQTRGMVGSIIELDLKNKHWLFCGVGNIFTKFNGLVLNKATMSYNGVLGLNVPIHMNDSKLIIEQDQLIIMASDGFRTRWDLAKYPGIQRSDCSIIAAALYKDHARRTDDMLVVVIRPFFQK